MIDYHCHLLPGLDDGPTGLDEALEMARALAGFGFRDIHCTPHCIAGHYEFSPVEVRAAVARLQGELDKAAIALNLHPGMEYALDDGFERFAANLLPLGGSRLVLCEAPQRVRPEMLVARLELIVVQGFIPLLAHPERCEATWQLLAEHRQLEEVAEAAVHRDGAAAAAGAWLQPFWRRWLPSGSATAGTGAGGGTVAEPLSSRLPAVPAELPECCLFQANLGSFTGCYGERVQRRAYELLQHNVYHCFASDLHEARAIPAFLDAARDKLQFNPALQRLARFVAPPLAQAGNAQLAFW